MRTFCRVAAAAALSLVLIVQRPAQSAPDPFEINAILSLTGPTAFGGVQEQRGLVALEAAVNKAGGIKGRPVHFHIYDDQGSPQVAVQLATPLIAQHVAVIIGPVIVANCRAVGPLVTAGPVVYCTSPGAPVELGNGYMFASSTANADNFRTSIRYFRERGLKNIALLTPTDSTGQEGERVILATIALPENRGETIVASEHFAPADLSVAAQIARIKQSNPQVLISWTSGASLVTVLRAASDGGLDVPVETNGGNMSFAQMDQVKDFIPAAGLFFPGPLFLAPPGSIPRGPTRAAIDRFIQAMHDAGADPVVPHLYTYDPAAIVVDAFRQLGTNATAEQLRAYLSKLHGYYGANGQYDFRDGSQRGLGPNAVLMVRWMPERRAFVGVSRPGGEPLP